MVLAPFAETKGARRPGRTPATQEITARREFGEKRETHTPTLLHLINLISRSMHENHDNTVRPEP